jgi:membrane dipeptidase
MNNTIINLKNGELERALLLLDKVPMIDVHNDLAWVVRTHPGAKGKVADYDLRILHEDGDTDIPRLREGKVSTQIFAAFVPTDIENPGQATIEQIEVVNDFSRIYPDVFHPVLTADDIMIAHEKGLIGSFLSVEGTVGLEGDLKQLADWQSRGVRLVTLCHNGSLPWVDSSTDKPISGGLSDLGRELIKELNRLGLIVDCSHASADAGHAAIDSSSAPIVFSHSNAQTLVPSPRNIPDDLLRRLAETGGMVMATFLKDYVSEEVRQWTAAVRPLLAGRFGADRMEILAEHSRKVGPCPDATLFQVADHIEYLASFVGRSSVGIGSDFYGIPTTPKGLEDVSRFPFLLAELFRRGWSDEDVAGVAGGNFIRIFRDVERASSN